MRPKTGELLIPAAALSSFSATVVASNCEKRGWDLTPSDAYVWNKGPPQGCSCQETGVPLAECKIFDCACVCDLTAGQCDVNCCCDVECTEVELERFAALETCLPEGPADEVTTTCYSTDALDQVNPKFALDGGGPVQSTLDGLLCVQYDNSGSKGDFTEDPGLLPTTIFSDSAGESEFSNHDALTSSRGTLVTEGDSFFDTGDRIPAAFASDDGGALAAFGAYLPVPTADDSGLCNDANYAGFGVPIPSLGGRENPCARVVEDLQEECASALDWQRYATELFVGTRGTVSPGDAVRDDNFVQVEVSSVTWRDWETGREIAFDDVNCGAFYYDGVYGTAATTSCLLGGSGGDTIATSTNAAEGCKNALVALCYTVYHDGEGGITAVTVDVVLSDVPPGSSGATHPAAVQQEFSIVFRYTSDVSADVTRGQELGNLVDRRRSGNPGYLPGSPVMIGTLETSGDDTYIGAGGSEGDGRLDIMVGTGRGCSSATALPVEFGYDAVGCCVQTLTREALAEHCEGMGEYVDPTTGFTPLAFRNTTVTHVGAYGNADPLDVSQWIEIPTASSSDTSLWDDDSGTCSSMVSTREVRFLYAAVGSKNNPQNKIVSAEARYGKTEWTWRQEAGSEQNFFLCNSVSFKLYDQESETYIPPSPPVAFTVPWDVFYPFFIATSDSIPAANPSLLTISALAAASIVGGHAN